MREKIFSIPSENMRANVYLWDTDTYPPKNQNPGGNNWQNMGFTRDVWIHSP